MTWVAEVLLCAVLVPLMFSISALFNIYPSWLQDWMLGIRSSALVLAMAAVPVAVTSKWVPIPIKILIVPLGFFLCFLLINGAGEQISMTRDAVSSGAVEKIHQAADLDKLIKDKGTELEGYVRALGWRVGSEDAVNAAKKTFATATEHKEAACKAAPFGTTCQKTTAEALTAQGKLTDATNDWEWTQGKERLEIEIPKLRNDKIKLHAPAEDPQLVAAARISDYWNKWGFKTTKESVNDRVPMDTAVAGELMSFLMPSVMIHLVHGFFSWLRSFARRKEDVAEDSSVVEQTPTPGVAVQPSPQIGTPTPHVVELAPQNEEPPPLAVEQTSTPMKRTSAPKKPKRGDYVEGVMEWMKGVAQTMEGERYTPSGLHLPYAKFCEREGFPIAPPNIFGSIVRNEGGLTTTKIKGQDYFRVAIRGANTTRLKVVKA
jgi:hypothetical protein